jgi:uncharacterized protein (TIGR03437 family)
VTRRALAALIAGAACAAGQSLAVVSAASYDGALAPDMIATAFSAQIRAGGAYSVTVGAAAATVFSAAAGQISFLIPAATPPGDVLVAVREQDRMVASATVRISAVAPGIFTANASGAGAPAGFLFDNGATTELFADAGGVYLARPFRAQPGQYLLLFGTGIRGWRSEVTATWGGRNVPVAAAVAQGTFAGLDQVNLGPLEAIADARGELEVALSVDGVAANRVVVAINSPLAGQWDARGRLLQANSEMAVAALDGKIYVLGGYPSTRQTQSTVQVYDPAADSWELAPPMPIPLNHNMAAAVGGRLYMIGGQTTDAGSGNFSDRVFEYDPAARQWRERSPMPTARGAGVAVVWEDLIYVAGGRPPRGADFAVYDPRADSWRALPDLPTQRNHLAGAAVGGRIYIAGGRFEGGANSPQSAALEAWDVAAGVWAPRARMPRPRGGINGLEAYGCIHVFGGEGNTGAPNGLYADHDVYNPATDSWSSLAPMPTAVHGVTGAVFLGGLIYLPGGGTSQGGNSGSLIHQVYRPAMVCR